MIQPLLRSPPLTLPGPLHGTTAAKTFYAFYSLYPLYRALFTGKPIGFKCTGVNPPPAPDRFMKPPIIHGAAPLQSRFQQEPRNARRVTTCIHHCCDLNNRLSAAIISKRLRLPGPKTPRIPACSPPPCFPTSTPIRY